MLRSAERPTANFAAADVLWSVFGAGAISEGESEGYRERRGLPQRAGTGGHMCASEEEHGGERGRRRERGRKAEVDGDSREAISKSGLMIEEFILETSVGHTF